MVLAGVGFVLQRALRLETRTLAQVLFYAFSPALVFTLLIEIPFSITEMARLALLVILLLAILAFVGWGVARLLHLNRTMTSATILAVTFMNAGNLGLPITQLAFGEVGLAWATVFFTTTALVVNSAGAWIASLGRTGPWKSLLGLAKVPAMYAIPLALILHGASVTVPPVVMVPIELLARATIPSMLILLGMQLAANGRPIRPRLLLGVSAIRLLVSPLLAWGLVSLFQVSGTAAQVTILEAAMPTAVLASILATQYEVEPEFVSGAILLTTVISPLTLTPLLLLLQ